MTFLTAVKILAGFGNNCDIRAIFKTNISTIRKITQKIVIWVFSFFNFVP